ncbi:MAG: PD-(D/E)XK nuclease family transposase [Saprospiraceae bacterium]
MSDGRPLVSFDWGYQKVVASKSQSCARRLPCVVAPTDHHQKHSGISGQKTEAQDKTNRWTFWENDKGELILIELQYNSENDYFHRMLFGTSKVITDYMERATLTIKVRKVYSINIVYFDLGQGEDYVYHGINEFRGIHTNDTLQVKVPDKRNSSAYSLWIYPEYYIIKVNSFNDIAKDTLMSGFITKNNRLRKTSVLHDWKRQRKS